MSRHYTKKIMEMVDDGYLSPKDVMNMCLRAMSEDDVKHMFIAEELLEAEEDEDEDEDKDED